MKDNRSDILLILDIDETLLYATKCKLEVAEDCILSGYYVYYRPFLSEFLEYVLNNFKTAIWSSATDSYVEEIVDWLGIGERLEFAWARSKVTIKRPKAVDYSGDLNENLIDDTYFVKRLKKVKNLGFPLERMLIIDNTPRKSIENYGNAIYVSDFEGNKNDNELKQLKDYLETLKDVGNLRTVEKRNWKN